MQKVLRELSYNHSALRSLLRFSFQVFSLSLISDIIYIRPWLLAMSPTIKSGIIPVVPDPNRPARNRENADIPLQGPRVLRIPTNPGAAIANRGIVRRNVVIAIGEIIHQARGPVHVQSRENCVIFYEIQWRP